MKQIITTILMSLLFVMTIQAQSGIIKGRVYDAINNEPIMFANLIIEGSDAGVTSDLDGNYAITDLEPGTYNLKISYLGYKDVIKYEVEVTNSKPAVIDVGMEENAEQLEEIVVKASPFNKTEESPVSLRTVGVAEIQRNPGGNRDISRVIQSLPGVTTTASFRNDLLIRGGGPNENRFYLDGVEVPVINHFATQGASGGPNGMINVDFIREVDFFSGAFPANRGNALSSVFEFKQKDGRDDRLGFRGTVGASDLALTLEGPIGKKTTFLVSARRSYLQFLFGLLDLPFLPSYWDFQTKVKYKPNNKSEFTFIGLGAIDRSVLNLEANETESQQFLLANLPEQFQWNYTNGIVYKRYQDNGYWTFVASRSMLNNESYKYFDNDDSNPDNLIQNYVSQEIENKLRIENTLRINGYKINYGVNYEFAKYNNQTFQQISLPNGELFTLDIDSEFSMNKYGFFGQVSKKYLEERLILSLGIRGDGNDFNDEMKNPLKQFSPRFSAAYAVNEQFILNFNTGLYYQLPAYTLLGYEEEDVLVNQDRVDYIQAFHLVGGIEVNTKANSKFTLEGFYKLYDNYPFLLQDSINIANIGGDFGAIGNSPAISNKQGRTYGLEALFQQKFYKGFYGIASYTLGISEFEDKNGNFTPSSWDSRHIIALTAGKQFKGNWEIGARWRFQSALPETPDDPNANLIPLWNVNGRALPNYDLLNTLRGSNFHGLDIRIDKKWFFDKWSLNAYFDVQNAYNFQTEQQTQVLNRDAAGNPTILNPRDPFTQQRYDTKNLVSLNGQALPTIGLIIEF
ncbi:MAG: carboxypeptidase-like regulatory domain-containing protein [Saprospiraceae bacterium]